MEEKDAACRVQALSRGRMCRTMRKKRVSLERESVGTIGRVFRGHAQRRRLSRCASRSLDEEDLRIGLGTLGVVDLSFAYTSLCVRNAFIDDISLVGKCRYLQSVDLSHNELVQATALESLPYLSKLDLKGNLLESFVLDLPLLAWLDLSRNNLVAVPTNPSLEHLILDHNRLANLADVDTLDQLEFLSASDNAITDVQSLPESLTDLRVDGNRLSFLDYLCSPRRLRKLSVSRNYLGSLQGLEKARCLLYIDASKNRIEYVREATEFLPEDVKDLDLRENPCTSLENYRPRVIFRLLSLDSLDSIKVTSIEKVDAINMNGGEESDLQHRIETHKKYLGDEPWIDYNPPFVEPETDPRLDQQRNIRRFLDIFFRRENVVLPY